MSASMYICDRCQDTHRMTLFVENDETDRVVMCTQCPRPCQECREGGNGPYCTTTPCSCPCHRPQDPALDVSTHGGDIAYLIEYIISSGLSVTIWPREADGVNVRIGAGPTCGASTVLEALTVALAAMRDETGGK